MGFDEKAALMAAGADAIDKVVNATCKGAGVVNDLLNEHTKRGETRKDGSVDRVIKLDKAKAENVGSYVDTAMNALKTVGEIYSKISESVTASKKLKEQIERRKSYFEHQKDLVMKDMQQIQVNHKENMKKIENDHEYRMKKEQDLHDAEMKKIDIVKDTVKDTLGFIIELAKKDPTNPFLCSSINALTGSLQSLNINSNISIEG